MSASVPAPADHAHHVGEHLEYSAQVHEQERVDQVLRRAGLRRDGSRIARIDGQPLTPEDCRAYLGAVRQLLGMASHLFAKAKFVLVDCRGAK